MEPDGLKRRGGKRRCVAFVADDDPSHVGIHGFGNSALAARVQPPLEVVALDDNRARNLPVRPALKLRTRIHEDRTVLRRVPRVGRVQPCQPRADSGKMTIEFVGQLGLAGHHTAYHSTAKKWQTVPVNTKICHTRWPYRIL